jgi:hypothetical protein
MKYKIGCQKSTTFEEKITSEESLNRIKNAYSFIERREITEAGKK